LKNGILYIASIFSSVFLLANTTANGQAELVINKATPVYMVLNGGTSVTPIYLVLHNGASSAITLTGAGAEGGIISESEFNMVWWDIGTNTGTYTLPFQYSTTRYIPLTFKNTGGAGVGSGTIKFSTYHTIADQKIGVVSTTGMPSDVTNMFPATSTSSPSATDDSYYVVDRFWIIDANGGSTPYTTKPSPILTFSYINNGGGGGGSEITAPNILTEGNLEAQRFNSTLSTWGDWFGPSGTDAAGAGTGTVTTTTAVTPGNFFRSWTLSDKSAPLPIQLTGFTAECQNYFALLQWTTATETNNDYFTIDRTQDGVNFETIAVVKGSGNSSTSHNYSAIDYSPLNGTSYYRISQTDFNGVTTNLNAITFKTCESTQSVNAFTLNNNTIDVQINSLADDNYTLTLMNTLGQVVFTQTKSASMGLNDYKLNTQVARGVYILQISGSDKVYSKKLYLGAL